MTKKQGKSNSEKLSKMEAVIGGQYILGKKVGNGAFGTIFEGYDKTSKRKVAIKLEIAKNGRYC